MASAKNLCNAVRSTKETMQTTQSQNIYILRSAAKTIRGISFEQRFETPLSVIVGRSFLWKTCIGLSSYIEYRFGDEMSHNGIRYLRPGTVTLHLLAVLVKGTPTLYEHTRHTARGPTKKPGTLSDASRISLHAETLHQSLVPPSSR